MGICHTGFLWARCHSYHPHISVTRSTENKSKKALIPSTEITHWPHFSFIYH